MKIGRNDPCPCGSGQKYKKCCLARDEAAARLDQEKAALAPAAVDTPLPNADVDLDGSLPEEAQARLFQAGTLAEAGGDDLEDGGGEPGRVEENGRDANALFPRPTFKLPELAPEAKGIVDGWWTEVLPFYQNRDTDALLPRILAFLDEHPELFAHLNLQEECLFEVGAELAARGQHARYVALLLRLRREQPQTYLECFGYYDVSIVQELTLTGRRSEIPDFFGYFQQYKDVDPDNCLELTNWLAWVDYQEELLALVRPLAVPLVTSENVFGGDFALTHLLRSAYFPFLDARDRSAQAAEAIQRVQRSMLPPGDEPIPVSDMRSVLEKTGPRPRGWLQERARAQRKNLLREVYWDFVGHLRWEKGCGWVKALFLADRLQEYHWRDRQPQDPFQIPPNTLEPHSARAYCHVIGVDAIRSLAFVQAVVLYADYLVGHAVMPPPANEPVIRGCRELYWKIANAVERGDPAFRLYPTFEALRGTGAD